MFRDMRRFKQTNNPYKYQDENLTIKALMKIKLLKRYDSEEFTFDVLKGEYGILKRLWRK